MSRERGTPATEVYNTRSQNDGGYGVGRWGERWNDGRQREDCNRDSSRYKNGLARDRYEYDRSRGQYDYDKSYPNRYNNVNNINRNSYGRYENWNRNTYSSANQSRAGYDNRGRNGYDNNNRGPAVKIMGERVSEATMWSHTAR
ncbi:hypothetical protein QAD02_003667 [Eretmocerus hayati]|uniref:Uncharacterized protein n=1 Tax=Eretmocerus hayati TaxID=131215 RepID=A0ACC2NNL2_9HYME|nr:hypothetical protein QAD02_003667 [Eretmocerus hayati]